MIPPQAIPLEPPKCNPSRYLHRYERLAGQVHYPGQAWDMGELGGTVTLIYSAPDVTPAKTRGALLPLLIILFVASYGILTMLVVEQGRTIEAQRGLLQEMLKDSTQLADLKGKMARAEAEQGQAKALAQMPAPSLKKEKEKILGEQRGCCPEIAEQRSSPFRKVGPDGEATSREASRGFAGRTPVDQHHLTGKNQRIRKWFCGKRPGSKAVGNSETLI